MSLSADMNKLAPKLTIVFQLTVWTVVAIVLLQKGTISLYEKTKTRNDTLNAKGNFTRWNKEELLANLNIAQNSSQPVKIQTGTREEDATTSDTDGDTSRGQWPLGLHAANRADNTGIEMLKTISSIRKQPAIRRADDTRDARSIQTPTVYANNKENVVIDLITKVRSYDTRNATMHHSTPSISIPPTNSTFPAFVAPNERKFYNHDNNEMSYKGIEKSKSERKSRRSPMNRIGAAMAIVMLAIGIVMLLLGPLIVVVRAFSNRRRTRQMLQKSRYSNDQPPSYEEATLMDQAPRYSTLQLDTILDSSFSL